MEVLGLLFLVYGLGIQLLKYRIAREIDPENWRRVFSTFAVLRPKQPRARQVRNLLIVWLIVGFAVMVFYGLFAVAKVQEHKGASWHVHY